MSRQFIKTENGYVSVGSINRIKFKDSKDCLIYCREGKETWTETVSGTHHDLIEAIERANATFVPAQQGFFGLSIYSDFYEYPIDGDYIETEFDYKGFHIEKEPIIAWRVDLLSGISPKCQYLTPIYIDGEGDTDCSNTIEANWVLYPDGKIHKFDNCAYYGLSVREFLVKMVDSRIQRHKEDHNVAASP